MKGPAAPVLPLLVLTLLAAGSIWLEQITRNEGLQQNAGVRHAPDFIIENFNTRSFTLKGELQHTLSAARMVHFPDDDSTEVTAPSLVYFDPLPPTRLAARQAWISRDGKMLRFSGDVRMLRDAYDGHPSAQIRTDEMQVFPDDEIARTNHPVTLTQGHSTLQGQGLEIDHAKQKTILYGRVTGSITSLKHP